jgi:hypothetical protein
MNVHSTRFTNALDFSDGIRTSFRADVYDDPWLP